MLVFDRPQMLELCSLVKDVEEREGEGEQQGRGERGC